MTECKNPDNDYIIKSVGSIVVRKNTPVGRVYLPKEWIGKTVKITMVKYPNE